MNSGPAHNVAILCPSDDLLDAVQRAMAGGRRLRAAPLLRHIVNTSLSAETRANAWLALSSVHAHAGRYTYALRDLDQAIATRCLGRAGPRGETAPAQLVAECDALRRCYRLWHHRSRMAQIDENTCPATRQRLQGVLLGSHHAATVFRLQLNGRDAMLGGLLRLHSVLHSQYWIEQNYMDGNLLIAIMCRTRGLVGIVCLRAAAPCAPEENRSFYYWIAEAYQRQGLGVQALNILKEIARRQGIERLDATVRADNLPSRKALASAGALLVPGGTENGLLHFTLAP